MTAARTAESPFPITRTWKRAGAGTVVSGDYKIVSSGETGFFASFALSFQGKRLTSCSTQREAKTAVEMHDAGFGATSVKFYNIVK